MAGLAIAGHFAMLEVGWSLSRPALSVSQDHNSGVFAQMHIAVQVNCPKGHVIDASITVCKDIRV